MQSDGLSANPGTTLAKSEFLDQSDKLRCRVWRAGKFQGAMISQEAEETKATIPACCQTLNPKRFQVAGYRGLG